LFLLTFIVKNDTSVSDHQNLSEEFINENIQDSNAHVENDPNIPLALNLQMKIEEVSKFPSIKPDRCVNTAKLQGISTKICIKSLTVDKFVSGSILSTGVWEKPIVMKVMRSMELYPNAVFLDIGANIGMYTVMVAAMHRRVIAVDPILTNLALIRSSLEVAENTQFVSFVNNPISDIVEILYPVTNNTANQGGTRLIPSHLLNPGLKKSISGDPVVSTTLHHLVEFSKAEEIIIKLDIEGFECKVLEPYLSKPTQDVFIPYIFMEWMHIKLNLDDNCPNLENLVQLFTDLDYIPWDASKRIKLVAKNFRTWKKIDDVMWIHKDAKSLL